MKKLSMCVKVVLLAPGRLSLLKLQRIFLWEHFPVLTVFFPCKIYTIIKICKNLYIYTLNPKFWHFHLSISPPPPPPPNLVIMFDSYVTIYTRILIFPTITGRNR